MQISRLAFGSLEMTLLSVFYKALRMTNHDLRFTNHEPRVTNMRGKASSIFGLFAAGLVTLFGKSPAKPTAEDLGRMEFKTSTQRLGVRFTEKIRDVFRFRWIKRF